MAHTFAFSSSVSSLTLVVVRSSTRAAPDVEPCVKQKGGRQRGEGSERRARRRVLLARAEKVKKKERDANYKKSSRHKARARTRRCPVFYLLACNEDIFGPLLSPAAPSPLGPCPSSWLCRWTSHAWAATAPGQGRGCAPGALGRNSWEGGCASTWRGASCLK
jgi:hypothetical protein